ncbi:Tudor domain-containing protein 1 isoform X7 [Oopsacas minuta]|uniref:Tudor domain-containing protein 1 isoform X7 n=1 Tax=Oopsacas minuta TaxID=111878 RepID=A0AAV7KH62_9METZ|nr:Tudor domain-containing protein 1 isoform X7 [Oopsacas minuta]
MFESGRNFLLALSHLQNLGYTNQIIVEVHEVEKDNHLPSVRVEVLEPPGLVDVLVNEGFAISTSQPASVTIYTATEGSIIQVEVSHVTPDHVIYCVPVTHGSKIDQIIAHLKSCQAHPPIFNAKIGQFVAAKSVTSGLWNRARVLSKIGKQKYQVMYIDIGTKEQVELSSLRRIPSCAANIPCRTFPSQLSHINEYAASSNYVQLFTGMVGVGTLLCQVHDIDEQGIHSIALKLPGGENLIDELVSQGALCKRDRNTLDTIYSAVSSKPALQVESYPFSFHTAILTDLLMSIALPSTSEVLVSHLDSPSNFYVQFANSHSQLQYLSDQINQHYSCLTEAQDKDITPTSIVHGAICCTRFAQDNLWYRGKVLDVIQDDVIIQYVDYGNTETKSVSEIKLMHPNFYVLPAQAIKCSLLEVTAKDDEWSIEASQLFQSLTFNKLLLCTFMDKPDSGIFYVSLIDPQSNVNIAQVLINSQYARPASIHEKKKINELEIKVNSQESVYISEIKTPGEDIFVDF